MMRRSSARCLVAAAAVLASVMLSGCGGSDSPAVCSEVDALRTSVDVLVNTDLNLDRLSTLQDDFDQVRSDLRDGRSAPEDEYATEIDAVDQAASSVGSALSAAKDSPSAGAVAEVGTSLQTLGTALSTLADAVKDTC